MKPIIRNFLSVIRRFKMAVALNILGLSVAFAAFMVIMIQLNYDYSFDKCHKDYNKIFRIESSNIFTENNALRLIVARPQNAGVLVVYALAFFIVGTITCTTVTFQN